MASSSRKETIAILGATGKLGQCLMREAQLRGYRVRAVVRNVERANQLAHEEEAIDESRFVSVQVDLAEFSDAEFANALLGNDDDDDDNGRVVCVMSALGAPGLFRESHVISTGAVRAMNAIVSRDNTIPLLICSAWGSGAIFEPHDGMLYKFFVNWIIYQPCLDHRRAELALENGARDNGARFMSVRPPGLTDGPRTDTPTIAVNDLFSLADASHLISRADVARFFFDQLAEQENDSNHWQHSVAIGHQ
jgi:nucleoside-diphosphate-sugar epimerase